MEQNKQIQKINLLEQIQANLKQIEQLLNDYFEFDEGSREAYLKAQQALRELFNSKES